MKRFLLLICTILCANVLLAQTEFMVGELLYQVTNPNEVEVKDCVPIATSIIIPTTVSNSGTTYTVTSIGDSAFYHCSSLTSVTIPNSVTSIGEYAFSGCSSLTSVTIPNSVTSIGERAFAGCSSLTSVTIGNSVTSIGDYTFSGCSSLTSVNIPNSVTEIGDWAFQNCSSLTSVTIGNGVTTIGESAFYHCTSLTSVTIGNSVTSIRSYAFEDCISLTTLNFNAINCSFSCSYSYYESNHPFYDCPISTINIGDSVQRIPDNFARGMYLINSITIPNSVTEIGDNAFRDCNSLTSVTIGNSVISIGDNAFRECWNLETITCLATTPPSIGNNIFYYTPAYKTLKVYCGFKNYYATVWGSYFAYNNIQEIPFAIDVNVNNEVGGNVTIENNCSTATLTATANDCYQFVSWNDGNTENPRIVSLTSDTSLTAIFEDLNTELIVNICEGQVYTENNFNVSETGVYTQNLTSVNGCDSIVTLTLNVNPHHNTELTATICPGERFIGNGFNVTAGVYTQSLHTIYGCDSIVTLTVTEYPTFDTTINATINAGETYAEFGFNESEAGTYVQNLQSINGCDSTITLILDVNSSLLDIEETEISLYPNPTKSEITFSQAIEKVEVIDLIGKTIFTFSNVRTINIESLPSGAYYLRLTNDEKTIMQKVIKQ